MCRLNGRVEQAFQVMSSDRILLNPTSSLRECQLSRARSHCDERRGTAGVPQSWAVGADPLIISLSAELRARFSSPDHAKERRTCGTFYAATAAFSSLTPFNSYFAGYVAVQHGHAAKPRRVVRLSPL